jgi:hypothetical protein
VTRDVSPARPSADDVRCTTLLNALAPSTWSGGTADRPPVMIGIMARPIPTARSTSTQTTCSVLLSRVTPVSM